MAPSRGFNVLRQLRARTYQPFLRWYSDFVRAATDAGNRSQVYISRSLDPYLNLSIEHYLLQKTPADSTILFLYTNRPCIVTGRNQNPWVEVNLGLLNNGELKVDLVRRRSGGGTVFHDEGNVNYSVVCPSSVFDRDRHAQMVVRALQQAGVDKAQVNERHDIVLDRAVDGGEKRFKISGSAYKLTRQRSLHHGTCLLSSPNLPIISKYLRSPAKLFIKAKGVESVSSPITNTGIGNEEFEEAVVSRFESMYGGNTMLVGETERDVSEIAKGLEELKSDDWIYGQTPQFTFSSNGVEEFAESTAANLFQHKLSIAFSARHGVMSEARVSGYGVQAAEVQEIMSKINDQKLHAILDWRDILPDEIPSDGGNLKPGLIMNRLLGRAV